VYFTVEIMVKSVYTKKSIISGVRGVAKKPTVTGDMDTGKKYFSAGRFQSVA
jgi:hypothetical protein